MQIREKPLLVLKTQASPEGEVAATIPVAWCVNDELIAEVKNRGFVNPHVLLIVRAGRIAAYGTLKTSEYVDTSYYLVRLTQELQYVNFTRPGSNEVRGIIVDLADKSDVKQLKMAMKKMRNDDSLIDEDGSLAEEWPVAFEQTIPARYVTSLEVKVPRQMFAPEPPQWRKTLVRRFWPYADERDQCSFRRRTIGAALLTPPFAVLGTVYKLVTTAFLAFFGVWKLAYHFFLKPMSNWDKVYADEDRFSSYVYKWKTDRHGRHEMRHPIIIMLMPPVLILLPQAVWLVFNVPVHYTGSEKTHPLVGWSYWHTVGVVDGLYVGGILAIFAFIGLCLGVGALFPKLKTYFTPVVAPIDRRLDAWSDSRRRRFHRDLVVELNEMVCNGHTPQAVEDLPPAKRTVNLRYLELKKSVCKPYAR